MGNDLEFTAGGLFALHTALGQGQAKTIESLAERLALFALTDFTDAEREALHWQEQPSGGATFDTAATLTRHLTPSKRGQIAAHVLTVAAGFPIPWVARWLQPALAVLGDSSLSPAQE
jgi:hypothetical protein